MDQSAVTLRATPARVYLALRILTSAAKPPQPGGRMVVKRTLLFEFCDEYGILDGKHQKRMKFRDALDRLVEAGIVERLPQGHVALAEAAPPPRLPEFDPYRSDSANFTDMVFSLYCAGLVELIVDKDHPKGAWRRTVKGLAYEQAQKATTLSPALQGDLIVKMIATVGGPENDPVDLWATLRGTFAPWDWQPIVRTLLAQERLYDYAGQLPTHDFMVVRADGPQDPTWRYYRAPKGHIFIMPAGSELPPGSNARPIDPPITRESFQSV